jgi:hypothetical protein
MMPTMSILRKIKHLPLIALLLVLTYLAGGGYVDRYFEMFGMRKITASNEEYLQKSFDKALNGFLALSGIKMGLAVVEGSEIGIGFNLQIGDLAQSAYDYVDLAWHTVLVGAIVLLMTRYLLQAAALFDNWCLTAVVLILLILLIVKWLFPNLRRGVLFVRGLGIYIGVLTVTLYFVLPVSINGAAFLSKKITAPSISEAQKGLETVQNELFGKNVPKRDDLLSKAKVVKERIDFVARYLKEKTREMSIWIIRLIAGYVFDCIVFPVGLFFLLFWLTKTVAKYLFEVKERQSFRHDLEEIFKKYRTFHY